MAIIDHEKYVAEQANEKTMALRTVTEDEVRDDPGFREDIARSQVLEYRPPQVDYPKAERKMRWAGPFPVRPVQSITGRITIKPPRMQDPLPRDPEGRTRETLEKFAKEATIEEIVEAVAILDDAEGVEEEPAETGTFALPAVWKMTGKSSTNKLAHRSAAHVQRLFNEAGWPIAVWYGEATKSYWVMDENGLHEFETITAMYQGMGWEAL